MIFPVCIVKKCKYLRKINSNPKQTTWGAHNNVNENIFLFFLIFLNTYAFCSWLRMAVEEPKILYKKLLLCCFFFFGSCNSNKFRDSRYITITYFHQISNPIVNPGGSNKCIHIHRSDILSVTKVNLMFKSNFIMNKSHTHALKNNNNKKKISFLFGSNRVEELFIYNIYFLNDLGII